STLLRNAEVPRRPPTSTRLAINSAIERPIAYSSVDRQNVCPGIRKSKKANAMIARLTATRRRAPTNRNDRKASLPYTPTAIIAASIVSAEPPRIARRLTDEPGPVPICAARSLLASPPARTSKEQSSSPCRRRAWGTECLKRRTIAPPVGPVEQRRDAYRLA